MSFRLPPRLRNEKGNLRTVGFELEFGGIELQESVQILQGLFGGHPQQKNRFHWVLAGTPLGDFEIKADSRFLSEKRYASYLEKVGLRTDESALTENLEDLLQSFTGVLLPFEIATPPLSIQSLEPADEIRRALHVKAAKGTKASLFSAFGMQINPEIPDFRAETVLIFLQAFFLLYDWLYEEADVALARKISPFISSFPKDYIDLIVSHDYDPTLEALMRDYLAYNPTRNRPLDMLPLFAYLNKDLVFSYKVEKELIKPRPTFHYRLPNSEVDDSAWTIAREWNKWVEIEKLADDPDRCAQMIDDYLETREEYSLLPRKSWAQKTRDWLHAPSR